MLSVIANKVAPVTNSVVIPATNVMFNPFKGAVSGALKGAFHGTLVTVANILGYYSFEVCLIVGLIALILSIFGLEKAKKVATLSPVVYIILQIFIYSI